MRYNEVIIRTREVAEFIMLDSIKAEDSLFLVNNKSLTHFLQLEQQLREVTLIMMTEEERFLKMQAQMTFDIWLILTIDHKNLLQHIENSMIFMVRQFFIDKFSNDPSLATLKADSQHDDRLAFIYAVYIVSTFGTAIDDFRKDTAEINKALNRIAEYQHRDLASLFDASYQTIEAYPREFVLIQREVIEAIDLLFTKNQRAMYTLTRSLMKEAKAVYNVIYEAGETKK